jgi:hypothetical protein
MDRDNEDVGIFLFFAAGTTVLAAFTLGYIAHYGFGLSRQETRTLALAVAAAIGFFVVAGGWARVVRKRQ